MTDRERFLATMHYQPRDRAPICDFGFWTETAELWKGQGLPEHLDENTASDFFGMDRFEGWVGIRDSLDPGFETVILEDRGDMEVVQGGDGVRILRHKFMSSIPMHFGHLLTDRESWEKQYKPRLDPHSLGRFPAAWPERVARWSNPRRPNCLTLPGGSLYGWIRNWMGVENVSLVVYDDPAWFEEMVETITVLICSILEKAFESGIQFDSCGMWEDMCYSGGPLLGVDHFKQILVPRYRRITDVLHKHGVEIVWLDCDGNIERLIPHWLGAGVNCMFPIEVGTWGGDPVRYRKEYGRDLLLLGGFDKHILAKGKREITAEVERLTPLVEEGGYIPFCDHRVPPDVSLDNYIYYLHLARERWGKGVNLKPMGQIWELAGVNR
ncbi:MAG: uroporphyrinogen decarboxylase family protein [Fimbriimonadales bacterium]